MNEEERKHRWSQIIKRYIRMAKANGIDSKRRKFAVDRWMHRKHGAEGTLTVEQWQEKIDRYEGCYFCGLNDRKMTIEHLIPKSIGGGFTKENIVPACKSCNWIRGTIYNVSLDLFMRIEFERLNPNA